MVESDSEMEIDTSASEITSESQGESEQDGISMDNLTRYSIPLRLVRS